MCVCSVALCASGQLYKVQHIRIHSKLGSLAPCPWVCVATLALTRDWRVAPRLNINFAVDFI